MQFDFFSILQKFDTSWFNQINHGLHNPFLDTLMPLISNAGSGGVIWIVFAIVLLAFGRQNTKKAAALMLLSLLASFLIGEEALKNFFRRPRPFETVQG
ncbi:MAG: hypothetical protein K6U74_16435, partial [Firmicutes bacterium]|nr:hypothetical protein [Bacillota bacterium]